MRRALPAVLFSTLVLPALPAQGTVTGKVWRDLDRDGHQDTSEPGLDNYRVRLLDGNSNLVKKRRTDATGSYLFAGIPAGEYRVAFRTPIGDDFAPTTVGSLDGAGHRVAADSDPLDSDVNVLNGHRSPLRRGPYDTGFQAYELTRLDASSEPWPVNVLALYPAEVDAGQASITVAEAYTSDAIDRTNTVATTKFLLQELYSLPPDGIGEADPASHVDDTAAVLDASIAAQGVFPIALLFPGWFGSSQDMLDLGDLLASHGYFVLCAESMATHASIALGSRLTRNGGPYLQSDFDHIRQLDPTRMQELESLGFDSDGTLCCAHFDRMVDSEAMAILGEDASFVIDHFEGLAGTSGHALEDRLDLGRVAWAGFSHGGNLAKPGVEADPVFDAVVNVNGNWTTWTDNPVSKPSLWVGFTGHHDSTAAALSVDLPGFQHMRFIHTPAVDGDPFGEDTLHREFHHRLRNHEIVSFFGFFLMEINQYREELGLNGEFDPLDGYTRDWRAERIPDPLSEQFLLMDGATVERDAGLVPVEVIGVDGRDSQLFALHTAFLEEGVDLGAAQLRDFGRLDYVPPGGVPRPVREVEAIAVHDGRAWIVSGERPSLRAPHLLSLDLATLVPGGPNRATWMAALHGTDRVRGASIDPIGGRLFLLVDGPGGPGAPDLLLVLDRDTGEILEEVGPLRSAEGAVEAGADLSFDHHGMLYVTDAWDDHLYQVSAATGRILALIDADQDEGLSGLAIEGLAWDPVSKTTFFSDVGLGLLGGLTRQTGQNVSYGSLAALGLDEVRAIALSGWAGSVTAGGVVTIDREHDLQALHGGVFTGTVRVESAGLDGARLTVRLVDGQAHPARDRLILREGGAVTLGATVEVTANDPWFREGREILHLGVVIGWMETDFGLTPSGEQLLPLDILLNASATDPAVADLVSCVGYEVVSGRPRSVLPVELRIRTASGVECNVVREIAR